MICIASNVLFLCFLSGAEHWVMSRCSSGFYCRCYLDLWPVRVLYHFGQFSRTCYELHACRNENFGTSQKWPLFSAREKMYDFLRFFPGFSYKGFGTSLDWPLRPLHFVDFGGCRIDRNATSIFGTYRMEMLKSSNWTRMPARLEGEISMKRCICVSSCLKPFTMATESGQLRVSIIYILAHHLTCHAQ